MKRVIYLLLLLSALSTTASAQSHPVTIHLWDQAQPRFHNGEKADETTATMEVFLPTEDVVPCRAVLLCPGGGYKMLASYHEGYLWAPFFAERGIATIVLNYRLPHGHKDVPLEDAEQAIRIIRLHAREWHIAPEHIGIMGFSAGGHLATTLATHAAEDARPAFQILFYPVVSMAPLFTHKGSHDNLLGTNASQQDEASFSNERQVKAWSPPAILIMTDDDRSVNPRNGIDYYLALKAKKIPASMHIYPHGGHGFGFDVSFRYHEAMLKDLSDWLSTEAKP